MSSQGSLLEGLERAALADDDDAFDAALDAALSQARSAANPGAGLRAAVSEHLRGALAPPALAPDAGSLGRDSGIIAIVRESGRSLRAVHGAGILAAGVAIGFVWGRAPAWQAEERAAIEASASTTSTSSANTLGASGAGANPGADSTASATVRSEAAASADALARADAAPASAQKSRARGPGRAKTKAKANTSGASALPPAAPDERLRLALQQLRKAQLFLRASEPGRALAALDELDARVPRGVLSEERDATRVLAWCDAGEAQKAQALAAGLLERAPESAYAPSLRESCAGPAQLLDAMRERTSNPPR